jgi:hypothetical protein
VSAATFSFEHFYHGQLLQGSTLQGEARLLASSPGIRSEHVAEALSAASIPPDEGFGAWALVRGRSIPFLLVQSQPGVRHYILITVEALRALGGNLKALLTLVEPQIKTFTATGHSLPRLTLLNPGIPTPAAQEEAMLDLMTATRDRLDVLEALLAAIIHGVQISISGAPPELEKRVVFVEGLLALLPPPARFGVTFTTYTQPEMQIDAQVCFYNGGDVPPQDTLLYHWGARAVTGIKVEDEYARFIRSQLRLDTGLVLEQTTILTPVAGWRIRAGDSLADALKYASYRLTLDNALINHQPVGAQEVARVLAEDPTLSDDLRVAYIHHLLAFALAMDEDENSDLLAMVARGQPDLERAILSEMSAALEEEKAERIYRRVMRWRSHPDGFRGMYWEELTQRAAAANVELLVRAGDPEALNAFLNEVREAMNPSELTVVAPQLIDLTLPLSAQHRHLAETVFVLAATALPTERWQRLISARSLLTQLPGGVAQVMTYISKRERSAPPPGLIAQVISDFEAQWRPLLFIRMIELVLLTERFDLLDPPAIEGLADAAATPWGEAYDTTIRWIARTLSSEALMAILNPGCRQPLLQLLLARRAFAELSNELLQQGRQFYPADKQLQFAQMAYSIFADSTLPVSEIPAALRIMAEKGVKPLPLAMAHFGALHRNEWSPALETSAADVTELVINNRLIAESLSPDMLMELLNYHIQRGDTRQGLRVASLLPAAASRRGEPGVTVMIQMYRMMNWGEEGNIAALDGLRRYIRRCSDTFVPQALTRLGRELGEPVRQALEATVTLYQMMGGEDIGDYAYSLHTASEFLYDTSLIYVDRNSAPSVSALMSDLDSLSGGLANDDRLALSNAMLEFGRLLSALAAQHRQLHFRESDEQIEGLLSGKGAANSVFDVLRVMGGYFARARRVSVRQERTVTQHPLGDRAAHVLLREVEQINRLFKTALRAIPADKRTNLSASALQDEIESLWGEISLHERRSLVRNLAIDLQRIPDLTLTITERADAKALQDDSGLARKLDSASRRPENVLEFYRFVHGYFKARVR